ncbi:MAG: hypothetical protein L0Y71_21255 [Gemmataceae bacterium]|nr:hypothetical protein [Gemmataceae bacterium]
MRTMPLLASLLFVGPLIAFAGDPPAKKSNDVPPKNGKNGADYAEFSKFVHGHVVKQVPKRFEHKDGWGATTPLPETRLRLPNLRTYLKDGDKVVLPHGAWKKIMIKFDDPHKDIKIRVTQFKPIDAKSYRLELEADAVLQADAELQLWQKGLMLIGAGADTDVFLNVSVGCDVGFTLNLIKNEIDLAPKITDLAIDLKDIRARGGPILTGERGQKLAANIKDLIRGAVKSMEPQLKEQANRAIAENLKDGKVTVPAGALLKALPK